VTAVEGPVLVHLAAGVGNIVLATPLLVALGRMGVTIDVWISADYPDTADLFRDWATVRGLVTGLHERYEAYVPAVPPFYWRRFSRCYRGLPHVVPRPPDPLFWADEQAYYLEFARALGYAEPAPRMCLPVAPSNHRGVTTSTVVLAPGCKTGEMAAKRWPGFPELSSRFDDVVVVGTRDDLRRFDGREMQFPPHVRVLTGELTLRQTAELLAGAGVVVANDSGLGHVAAALGVPAILLFGPTPHRTLGQFPPNVTVVRAGLPCEPCWFGGPRFAACQGRIDCLSRIAAADVAGLVAERLAVAAESA
jgi:Glycosyltransferase family 9 (heptosyltransferase)